MSSSSIPTVSKGFAMATRFILIISASERHIVELIEVCKPRSAFDTETHRVRIIGGGIIRVSESQLKPC